MFRRIASFVVPFFCIKKKNLNKLGTVENPEEVFFLKLLANCRLLRDFFSLSLSKSEGFCNCNARSLPLSLSLSPLLKAIQPGLAGSQILSAFAVCALDYTRLCRSCNRFAVSLSSPSALVYFRNRCNLPSNHALGARGSLRRGPGGGREKALPPSPLLPSLSPPVSSSPTACGQSEPRYSAQAPVRSLFGRKAPVLPGPACGDPVFGALKFLCLRTSRC